MHLHHTTLPLNFSVVIATCAPLRIMNDSNSSNMHPDRLHQEKLVPAVHATSSHQLPQSTNPSTNPPIDSLLPPPPSAWSALQQLQFQQQQMMMMMLCFQQINMTNMHIASHPNAPHPSPTNTAYPPFLNDEHGVDLSSPPSPDSNDTMTQFKKRMSLHRLLLLMNQQC